MAKLLFFVSVAACLVATSRPQQSWERQFAAFKIFQSIEKQVLLARELSDRVENLLDNARAELEDLIINIKSSDEFSLNYTLQPYVEVILEAFQTVIGTGNNASIACVATARASVNQQLINAVAKDVFDCKVKIRNKLSEYIVKLAVQDSSKGTTIFNALSECPYSFQIETASDFEDAKTCYTKANDTITQYIKQKLTEVDDSYVTFYGLQIQARDCLSRGMRALERQGQAAVGAMAACGKAAGVWLISANAATAVKAGSASLETYISQARKYIQPYYLNLNSIIEKFNKINKTLESEYVTAMQKTLDKIVYVETFLNDSKNAEEVKCVTTARGLYATVINQEIYLAQRCLNNITARFTDVSLIDTNLQALLDKAVSYSIFWCSSKLPLSAESVGKCFEYELSQLQDNVGGVLKDADTVVKKAENLYQSGLTCFDYHKNRTINLGIGVLNNLSNCLLKLNIEFVFQ